ncbi:filamentous hemagglutinin [Pseudomonas fluorescens ABAC62]|nr:filamentous hemagglutinin [Pseudomonas fluorescens ABAC62]
MPTVHIMSVIGSAVPASLRELGVLACWYLVRDGETISGPLTSLSAAETQLQHAASFRLH